MILTNKDLTIRNASTADAEQLCTWWNDGAVMAHAGFPNGVGDTPERIRQSLAADTDETHRRHIIEFAGKPIGEMNYRNKGDSTAEIGIKICDSSEQNKGYGTMLLSMFIDALFRYFNYDKIILDTNVKNERAQHVYEKKLGFEKLGIRENAWCDQLGELQSSVDYDLKKKDWLAEHPGYGSTYLRLRMEKPENYYAVDSLTREAFWGFMHPTCDEHYLAHLLRNIPAFVPELDYIAEADGKLIGNVMYSKAKVINSEGVEHEVLTFGPLSVLPEYWNRGVGSALMRYTISEAKRLGFRAIIFYGHPDYYPRFGFRSAKTYNITAPGGVSYDALMAMPLYDGALEGISGAFHEDPVFSINAEEATVYDRNFPHKEPATMLPITLLLDKLEPSSRKAFNERNITTLAWLNRFSGREMLTWDGIDEHALNIINQTLKEYSYAKKLLPSSNIFKRAGLGIEISMFLNTAREGR